MEPLKKAVVNGLICPECQSTYQGARAKAPAEGEAYFCSHRQVIILPCPVRLDRIADYLDAFVVVPGVSQEDFEVHVAQRGGKELHKGELQRRVMDKVNRRVAVVEQLGRQVAAQRNGNGHYI